MITNPPFAPPQPAVPAPVIAAPVIPSLAAPVIPSLAAPAAAPAPLRDLRPPAASPRARPRDPALPLEKVAAIRVALWESGSAPEGQLDRHGVEELSWREGERRIADALAEEAEHGRADQAAAIVEALKQAKAEASPAEADELTLDAYVALRVALDAAREAKPVLKARGLTAAAWQRIHKAWQARALADAKVAAEIRAKIAEARKAAAPGASKSSKGDKPSKVGARRNAYLGPRAKQPS
ncbi:MAG: hypothetical protein QM820_04300 [Minicystis sp.]